LNQLAMKNRLRESPLPLPEVAFTGEQPIAKQTIETAEILGFGE
jgi:hypothetical protein